MHNAYLDWWFSSFAPLSPPPTLNKCRMHPLLSIVWWPVQMSQSRGMIIRFSIARAVFFLLQWSNLGDSYGFLILSATYLEKDQVALMINA